MTWTTRRYGKRTIKRCKRLHFVSKYLLIIYPGYLFVRQSTNNSQENWVHNQDYFINDRVVELCCDKVAAEKKSSDNFYNKNYQSRFLNLVSQYALRHIVPRMTESICIALGFSMPYNLRMPVELQHMGFLPLLLCTLEHTLETKPK